MPRTSPRLPFRLSGKWSHRLMSLQALYHATLFVALRRLARGPRLPNWSWSFETAIRFLQLQTARAFDMADPAEGRAYESSLVFHSPAVAKVEIEPVAAPVSGHWFRPRASASGSSRDLTVLYLHGGGYAYYAKAHANLVALVTLATGARTFAPDYRLIPEHPFPAQLDDARAAYAWLLARGVRPERLVVIGDSAGGNLTLALLLALRDAGEPLPALGVGIAPWTDVGNSGASMRDNEAYDWVEKRMADCWAEWLCRDADPRDPLVSPIHADLQGLPPIYLQAGDAEILYDMIRAFAEQARARGHDTTLDVWPGMNHDFQAFGDAIPESREALARLGEVVARHVP